MIQRFDVPTDIAIKDATSGVTATIKTNVHTGDNELLVIEENHVCTGNTTTTPLAGNATFTGEWQDCLNYQEVNVSIVSDKNSATNGLVFQWSADGIAIGDTDVFSYYTASGGTNYTPNPAFRYVRMVYTNGSAAQTTFSLQTILRTKMTGGSFHRIDTTLKDDSDGRLVVSVPKLKTASNTYVSQTATNSGNAKISLEELESGVSTNNKTQLKVTPYTSAGVEGIVIKDGANTTYASVEARSQTPTRNNALQVQIGPGDVISYIPVIIDYTHHQNHEAEAWQWFNIGALNASTRDIRISVPTLMPTLQTPHMIFELVSDNTTVIASLYEGTTFTSGGTDDSSKIYLRNRNGTNVSSTKIYISGATALTPNVLGTQLNQYYLFTGKSSINSSVDTQEWILKSNTEYLFRVTTTGTGTVLVRITFYEDLGV